ncbi:hypothetical protein CEXT_461401 [Caerostris extrusa]|uniref:Uncharacterized protein n=1 Tax=Caerostris extrusa TaxID=172846 RepID=A0AAV4XNE0_CAEEX|nr:hypothetical protein CEXT_461401 [Caerostris extrusa]
MKKKIPNPAITTSRKPPQPQERTRLLLLEARDNEWENDRCWKMSEALAMRLKKGDVSLQGFVLYTSPYNNSTLARKTIFSNTHFFPKREKLKPEKPSLTFPEKEIICRSQTFLNAIVCASHPPPPLTSLAKIPLYHLSVANSFLLFFPDRYIPPGKISPEIIRNLSRQEKKSLKIRGISPSSVS